MCTISGDEHPDFMQHELVTLDVHATDTSNMIEESGTMEENVED
jgi:hypothetical protein